MKHTLQLWFSRNPFPRTLFCLIGGIVCAVFSRCAMAQDIPDDFGPPIVRSKVVYLSPENFTANEDYAAFRAQAHEFLSEHPDHVLAPRALLDLILVHSTLPKPDPNVTNGYKVRLALEYPESLATQFTIKSFKDQAEYRNLLTADFRKANRDYSSDYCRQFLKACELGLNAFGPGFVGEDGLQFQIRLALSEVKSFRLNQLNEAHAEKLKELPKRGFEICRQTELSLVDRITSLHQLVQTATDSQQSQLQGIKDAEEFWASRLTDEEREHPQILAILIEKRLEVRKFEEALEGLPRLLVLTTEPKFLFWHAWCLAHVDRTAEALQVVQSLHKQFPNDPWSKQGGELATALREQGQAIMEQSAAIQELVTDLTAENLEQLRINAQYHLANGKSLDLDARVVDESLDVFVFQNEQPLVGYKATLKDYSLFLKDQSNRSEVIQIAKPGVFPDLKLGFNMTPEGPKYEFHFNTSSTAEAAQSWRRAILGIVKNPLLANREAIQAMLRLNAMKNGFPLRLKTDGDHQSLIWLTPRVNAPEMQRFELELGPQGHHELSLRFTRFVADIKYGQRKSTSDTNSAWNQLPVVQKADVDLAVVMRAISLATSLLNPELNQADSPAETSSKKSVTP